MSDVVTTLSCLLPAPAGLPMPSSVICTRFPGPTAAKTSHSTVSAAVSKQNPTLVPSTATAPVGDPVRSVPAGNVSVMVLLPMSSAQ